MKKILAMLEQKPVVFSVILSIALHLFIEILARRSIFSTIAYIIANPFIAVYNCVIILFTLSIALYFSKKYSVFMIVCFLWMVLGVVNSVLIGLRGTPLSAVDFTILKSAYTLIKLYVSPPLLILFIILAIAAIAAIIFLFIRTPKRKPAYLKAVFLTILSAFSIFFISKSLITSESLTASANDLSKTYGKYGFACCFSYSLLGHGIDTPPSYSEDSINNILKDIDYSETYKLKNNPNIIMVQLESFFDPSYIDIKGFKFSEEPIPNFKNLKSSNTHGFLKVPSFGGGTANTEFEVLTQINIHTFGLGEYPYTTALKENVCESAAHNLKKNGYKSHAMHNHTATFYDRDIVYKNLGFDTFTPIEYMTDIERNKLGWAKDSILTKEILKALESTNEKDFVFAVSVQGHGQYPSEYDGELSVTVSGIEDPEIKTNLEYYLTQIHEMDMFIGDLTNKLSQYPEDTIVVFYGDHLPSLKLGEINNSELGYYPISCDRYSTEYVIWSNFGLEEKNEDLPAYKLSSKVLDMTGIRTGIITQLNLKKNLPADVYRSYTKMCAYDMLYGNGYINSLENLAPANMKMGTEDIEILGINVSGDDAYITGSGFTEYSSVWGDGKEYKTELISSSLLRIDADNLYKGMQISVKQKTESKILSSSNTIYY